MVSRTFASPDEFIAWVRTQSADIQREIALTVETLIDSGISGREAAHMAYDLVQAVNEAMQSKHASKPFDPTVN